MDNDHMTPERWRLLQGAYDVLIEALPNSHVTHSWFTAMRVDDGVRIFLPDTARVVRGEVVEMMSMPNVRMGGR